MLATACQKGVYQDNETYRKWALHAYRRAWKLLAKEHSYERPPEDLLATVMSRVARLRCLTEVICRWPPGSLGSAPKSRSGLGPSSSMDTAFVTRRIASATRLTTAVYLPNFGRMLFTAAYVSSVCHGDIVDTLDQDLIPDEDQYENEQFLRAMWAGLFWSKDSLGVQYWKKFDPMPVPAVAFILTMVCELCDPTCCY
jgi:hypothetical protein